MKELNNILSDKMKQLVKEYGTIGELTASKIIERHPQLKEHEHRLAKLVSEETIFEMDDITFRRAKLYRDGTTQYDKYEDLLNAIDDIGETKTSLLYEAMIEIDEVYIHDFDVLGLCEMSKGTQFYEYYSQAILDYIYSGFCADEELKAFIEYFGEDSVIAEIAKSRLTE